MNDTEFIQQLRSREEIQSLVNSYATTLDTKIFEDLSGILTENIQSNFGGYICDGIDDFMHMVKSHLAGCGPTQHLFSNLRVTVDDDSANVKFYASIMHAGVGDQSELLLHIWSEYEGTLVLTERGWRFSQFNQMPIKMKGDMSILKG